MKAINRTSAVLRQTKQRLKAQTHLETKRLLTIQEETNRVLQLTNASLSESEERHYADRANAVIAIPINKHVQIHFDSAVPRYDTYRHRVPFLSSWWTKR